MVKVEHTLIVRCDTLFEYNWALSQLQAAYTQQNTNPPIQSISPFLAQKRINVTYVTQDIQVSGN